MKKKKKNLKGPKNIEDFALRDLGGIFRRERERRRLTQIEIADRIGKSRTAVILYENGQRAIHWGTFIKLCSAIRVSPGFILERWMESDSFDVLDEERRKEYHDVIDEMIKYGFSSELDNLLIYFRGLISKEKEMRERERFREKIQKEYRAIKELKGEQGGQGDKDV